MASIEIINSDTDIDYSLLDRRVTRFICEGNVLYDEKEHIITPGWREKVTEVLEEIGLPDDLKK